MFTRTKIVATIGPASLAKETIEEMISQGLNVARINTSHGDHDQYRRIIKDLRSVAKKLKKNVAIMLDLQGPKIRLGNLPEAGISYKKGESIVFTTGTPKMHEVPVQYVNLHKDVKVGDSLLIQDGLLEFKIQEIQGRLIKAKALNGGVLYSKKGINLPNSSISADPLTEADLKNLEFGISLDVDLVALSFVKEAKDIERIQKIIAAAKSRMGVIAKIERHEAVDNLHEIVEVADGIMVARGDLGVEIPAEQIPNIQRQIISEAVNHGKPVITATQMLYSMVNNPRPSRAEVSDVATAVLHHTDAVMLSDETATGKYPVEAVACMRKIAHFIENNKHNYHELYLYNIPEIDMTHTTDPIDRKITNALALTACKLARSIKAKYIVCSTVSGYTAKQIARYRPESSLLVFTPHPTVQRQMALVWGVDEAILMDAIHYTKREAEYRENLHVINELPKLRDIQPGDSIVICTTSPVQSDRRNVLHVYTY